MGTRKIAATWLHTQSGEPIRNGGVTVASNGEIVEIFQLDGVEPEGVEFHSGILTPGFVNAHTHMELSFFDGVFVPGGSMVAFLRQIDSLRIDIDQERINRSLEKGYEALRADGQVAYADISNAADTVPFKAHEQFMSVSFVEVFGVNAELANKAWSTGRSVWEAYQQAGVQRAYMTPHAPYSVGRELWSLLEPELEKAPIFSLHFAETPQEMEFMEQGTGAMEYLYAHVWKRETNVPPMDTVMEYLRRFGALGKRILLVHCTALTQPMMQQIKEYCPQATIVLCPASNLFIGGAMPPVELLRKEGMRLAVGTDSLSSSPTLSILEQLRILNRYNPVLPIAELFTWATLGGAEACGFEGLGRIAVGAHPGVNLITGPNLMHNSLEEASVTPIASRLALVG